MMHYQRAVTIAAGLIVASGAAAAVFALMLGGIGVFTPTFVIVAIVAVSLGLPVYLAARAARNDTPMVAAAMGFVVGAVIPTLLVLASAPDQASVGGTATVIDGRYTLAGWMQSLALIGFFGLLGVFAALVFWFIVRRSAPTEEQGEETSAPLRASLLSVAAAGVVVAAVIIPHASADQSCHNPLRGGGTSIALTASFDLRVDVDQWRNVEAEMQRFRRSGDWSVRSDVRTDDDFPWLQISLCNETGTNIFVQGMPSFNEVSFGVYQPQGGDTWRRDFRALYDLISRRWPTKVTFEDSRGAAERSARMGSGQEAPVGNANVRIGSKADLAP
ncbi:hypothetical protein SH591_12280 [Sphingomonas sp. LY54]|uniref:hypothetical protein n=1 Tax=Sphingomonas sp. LY54 TaxID=3095343 RepID=UPI002D79AD8E|nr:hypothetical protein [Sphingomonas sp. LY54]WRP27877.1 hypothetical protein SH591_12280 [Sphingomonas sp. LY54]